MRALRRIRRRPVARITSGGTAAIPETGDRSQPRQLQREAL